VRKIGILFGMEDTFPWVLIDRINEMGVEDIRAEALKTDAPRMAVPLGYSVILDRISHDIPFYRAMLKNEVLCGTQVINNPFWAQADDKFFENALATKLNVPVPRTVILPHHDHPPGTTSKSMRNLNYPLDWDAVFSYIGFPGFLKPYYGGGWRDVYKVHNPDEFFGAYNQTGTLLMVYEEAIEFQTYYRCYCVGRKHVHIMPYDPRKEFFFRYDANYPPMTSELEERITRYALALNRALGYDLNTAEFAVRDGVPIAIDFMNWAPDCERYVGESNFQWVVDAVARTLIERVLEPAEDLLQETCMGLMGPPAGLMESLSA
jgi:hypothetical protein